MMRTMITMITIVPSPMYMAILSWLTVTPHALPTG